MTDTNGDSNLSSQLITNQSKDTSNDDKKDDYSTRKEIKIKDLLVSIQVLKNGVLEERKKVSSLEQEIARHQATISNRDNLISLKEKEIISIRNELDDLHNKLNMEKKQHYSVKNILGNFFVGTEIHQQHELEKNSLMEENTDLRSQNEYLKQKLEEYAQEFEKCKEEYQRNLKIQQEKMREVEGQMNEKNRLIVEGQQRLDMMTSNFDKFEKKIMNQEYKILELTKENNGYINKVEELLVKNEDNEKIIQFYKESLERHERESGELARKLALYKNALIETHMHTQTFKCEKVGSNWKGEITFGQAEDDRYVMAIKENNSDDEEYVSIEDIEYIRINEIYPDRIDLSILVKILFIIT